MLEKVNLLDLFKAGVHFGHRTSRWHPKMKPFIFGQKNSIHIINLEKTIEMIEKAVEFIIKIVGGGGTILFVGTKKQAQPIIEKYAKECNMPYVTDRWLGGTFTNFTEVRKLVQHYISLKERKEKGELAKYTKKEQLDFEREINKLERYIIGLVHLKKLPDAVFFVDIKTDETALREAHKKQIPIISICDTNVNPDPVTYPIAANDDGIKSLELITSIIAKAVQEGILEKNKKTNAQ